MRNPFFSIIVPCYNVEKYVKECIDSILMQSIDDYEIIAINDGSTDTTYDILKENYENNRYVKIINQENKGLSETRNVGIMNSVGTYLIFIDSDDYWNNSDALKKIKNYIEKFNSDVILIGYTKIYPDGKMVEKKRINFCQEKGIDYLIKTNYFKACAWDKIVKRELIVSNNIFFPKGLLSEDIIWCANILKVTKEIGCIEENFYMYRQRGDSITKNVKEKNILDMVNMINDAKCDNYIVNSYLAYEYTVALGLVSTKMIKNKICYDTRKTLFSLSYMLKNNLNDKVKKVYILYKIVGIKLTSLCLGIFIDKK